MARKTLAEFRGLVLGWGPQGGEDAPFIQRLWPAVLTAAGDGNGLNVDEKTLETLLGGCARDCLNSRKRRDELVEAFRPMLEASSDTQKAATDLINATLDYHDRHLADNGGVCKLGKFHNVLYVVASIAVEQNVKDSAVIGRLLRALHQCEGGLDRLMTPAVLGPKVSHLLSSWRSDSDTPEEARQRLQFFLEHAQVLRLTVSQPTGPSASIVNAELPTLQGASPLYAAVQAADEDAVLLLLQNGAQPVRGDQFCPFLMAVRRLTTHARATISQRNPCLCPETLCPCFFQHPIEYPVEALGVLRLLLRSMGERQVPHEPELLHPRILTDKVLGGPPSLKHWARYSLRSALLRVWALPHGTRLLGLPEPLVDYLNLSHD